MSVYRTIGPLVFSSLLKTLEAIFNNIKLLKVLRVSDQAGDDLIQRSCSLTNYS